ncbi:RibD family protein [Nocardia carnea]|uniref:RibD family protein n=1 Tax=Nocardia carnea TaxID=37328 RepID=UPI0024558196|nr:dihydrofolate reductase family protein [Nocardia carnea]
MVRPYVLLSVATSVDGYIDDTSDERLLLSNADDFARVDEVRAGVDAILVGAETIRSDNPRLIVKSGELTAQRVRAGKTAQPVKVTVTASGNLDPDAKFWHHGTEQQKPLVYTTTAGAEKLTRLAGVAEIVDLGPVVDFAALVDDLGRLGIERLMVEGGGTIHTAFLSSGLADELHLAIGPTLVGEPDAPRFLHPAAFPGGPTHRMRLLDITQIGDVALLRYEPPKENR